MIECIVFVGINPCIINYHHQSGVRGWCGAGDIFAIFNNSHIWLHAQLIFYSSFNQQSSEKINAKNAQNEMMSIWGMNEIFDPLKQKQLFSIIITMVMIARGAQMFQWIIGHHSKIFFFTTQLNRNISMTRRAGGFVRLPIKSTERQSKQGM